MIRTRLTSPEQKLPLIVEPDRQGRSVSELSQWASGNRTYLAKQLLEHGAVLFRGFSGTTVQLFEDFVEACGAEIMTYQGGNSPRRSISSKVYNTTDYPSSAFITLHNELSYLNQYPRRAFFCCQVPSVVGGETPVVSSRLLMEVIPADIRDRFISRGLRYVENMHGSVGLGRSWQEVFESTEKEDVERFCEREGAIVEWRDDNSLRIVYERDAVRTHPDTGETVWFNQADQWHPAAMDSETRDSLRKILSEDRFPHYCTYGDGSQIADEDIRTIRDVARAHAVMFPWQTDDILVVDNLLTAHGRMPFQGERRILIAMTDRAPV